MKLAPKLILTDEKIKKSSSKKNQQASSVKSFEVKQGNTKSSV